MSVRASIISAIVDGALLLSGRRSIEEVFGESEEKEDKKKKEGKNEEKISDNKERKKEIISSRLMKERLEKMKKEGKTNIEENSYSKDVENDKDNITETIKERKTIQWGRLRRFDKKFYFTYIFFRSFYNLIYYCL